MVQNLTTSLSNQLLNLCRLQRLGMLEMKKYDVLGYGYDVTGEYLHPLSVRNPVLNIAKYEQEHFDRLQYNTSSYGFDQMYYGYSASDYTKDITKETKLLLI